MPLDASEHNATLTAERVLDASARRIFAAFERAEVLERWWGPKGFTNTFELCEFREGGHWVYVMHGPTGGRFPNESVFRAVEPDRRIVIEHVVTPWYRLTVTLTPRGEQTHVLWEQEFESPKIAEKMRRVIGSANEENLDRLQAVLAEQDG